MTFGEVERRLFAAIEAGESEHVKAILKENNPDMCAFSNGETFFTLASKNQQEWIMRLLLAHTGPAHQAIDLEEQRGGDTPLIIASRLGHSWIAWALLANQAQIDISNKKGETALYVAAANNHLETLKVLLELGANPNIPTNSGDDPLSVAIKNEYATASEMIQNGGSASTDGSLPIPPLEETYLQETQGISSSLSLVSKLLQGKAFLGK